MEGKAKANWAGHEAPPSGVYPEPVEGDTLSKAILWTPESDDLNFPCVSPIFLVVFGGGTNPKSRRIVVGGG